MKVLKIFEDLFDFSNLNENLELLSHKNKTVNGKFEIQTPKFVCLKSKMYAFDRNVCV